MAVANFAIRYFTEFLIQQSALLFSDNVRQAAVCKWRDIRTVSLRAHLTDG